VPAIPPFELLTDDLRAELAQAVQAAGFSLLITEVDDWRPRGAFVAQSPQAGDTAVAGSLLTVSISTGEGVAPPLPDVRGMVYAEAKEKLEQAGYLVSREDVVVQEESAFGRVVAMTPQAGTPLVPDGTEEARVRLRVGVPPPLNLQPIVPLQ
jgi:serine/threonine-protein kinase